VATQRRPELYLVLMLLSRAWVKAALMEPIVLVHLKLDCSKLVIDSCILVSAIAKVADADSQASATSFTESCSNKIKDYSVNLLFYDSLHLGMRLSTASIPVLEIGC